MNKRKSAICFFLLIVKIMVLGSADPAWSEFNPPCDLEIEKTWSMMAYGESIGVIRGITRTDTINGKVYIKQQFSGMVGIREGVSLHSSETVWIGPGGMAFFKGTFQESGSRDKSTMDAKLEGDALSFDLTMKPGDLVYTESFIKDFDYNWSTAYIDVYQQRFQKNKRFKKKILDIYELKSKEVTGVYLGTQMVEQGGHRLECHKIQFDYGDIKGIMWLAKDELSWFLVKEEAEGGGVPFQMYLDEYTKKKKETVSQKKASDKNDFGF